MGDRMRHHGTQPANERFEDGIQGQRARAGDEQVGREPPLPPDREDDRRRRDHRPEHAIAAQPGDRLDDAHRRGVAGDQAVEIGCGSVVGRFQRRPLQAHSDEQDGEDHRRDGHRDERRETAVPAADGFGFHGRGTALSANAHTSSPLAFVAETAGALAGTQIVIELGRALIRISLRAGRAPPSSSYGTFRSNRILALAPRVISAKAESSARPNASLPKTRAQSTGFFAVTTPSSSSPSSGRAPGKASIPPSIVPTFAASTHETGPLKKRSPSTSTVAFIRRAPRFLIPVYR